MVESTINTGKIDYDKIAKRIIDLMSNHSMTQKELANKLHISQPSVSLWLKGNQIPLEHLLSICDLFSVSLDWLVRGNGPAKKADDKTRCIIDICHSFLKLNSFCDIDIHVEEDGREKITRAKKVYVTLSPIITSDFFREDNEYTYEKNTFSISAYVVQEFLLGYKQINGISGINEDDKLKTLTQLPLKILRNAKIYEDKTNPGYLVNDYTRYGKPHTPFWGQGVCDDDVPF